jgi:hypothetical protein
VISVEAWFIYACGEAGAEIERSLTFVVKRVAVKRFAA